MSNESNPNPTEVRTEDQPLTTMKERSIAALSYFSFLAIIPFYLKKDSDFCKFHGKQGMFLAILFALSQGFSVVDFLHDLLIILQFGMMLYMGYQAVSGQWTKIPFFYDVADKLAESLSLQTDEEIEAERQKKSQ